MLAAHSKQAFSGNVWLFEIKWDGYRAIAECRQNASRLYSRNAISFHQKYKAVFEAVCAIRTPMTLDGEIVVLDDKGKPDFQKLQLYGQNESGAIAFYVFDILSYKNKDLTRQPLTERKKVLQKVLPQNDIIKYSDHVENDGEAFFKTMQQRNLEGMMAKKKSSLYLPGTRNPDWIKIKHQQIDEAVIAGFTAPRGKRKYFGALLLGKYKNGRLVYVGHSGTGFDNETLADLHRQMTPLVTDQKPFANKVPVNNKVTWVMPRLVANIHYSELTKTGIMRHPVFQGLRIDKTVSDMKNESEEKNSKPASQKTKKNETNTIKAGNRKLELSNLDKVFWPEEGITKGDVIMYYNEVYQHIIPYLRHRPQSLRRTPNGILDSGFFQKDVSTVAPDWANTVSLYSESGDKDIEYLLCNDKATLLFMANLGCIELNPWNSSVKNIDHPDYCILDLDPSSNNSFDDVVEAALVIKQLLGKAGAEGYCKTSGASGLHIYIPLGGRYTYDESRLFAELIAKFAVEQVPRLATVERSIDKRDNKLYIDYLQNKRGQTLAAPYSVRPKPGATVSAPLEWKEVKKGLHPAQFTLRNMLKRIQKKGDLFKPVLRKGIDLPKALRQLEGK